MRLGYLHVGPPEHGVCRYGRLLAAQARQRSELTVLEAQVTLTTDRQRNRELLTAAAQQLATAEVIHLQYSGSNNKPLWGGGWEQLRHLRQFRRLCRCPLVVTLHDVYDLPPSWKSVLKLVYRKLQPAAVTAAPQTHQPQPPSPPESAPVATSSVTKAVRLLRFMSNPDALALRWLWRQVKLILVCSAEEARRLSAFVDNSDKIGVVPHFVEQRSLSISSSAARAALQLNQQQKIVTLLGFIHHRKGHQLLVEAIPELPPDVLVVFAGGHSPGNAEFLQQLLAMAQQTGVGDRLRVTGYLSEAELEKYLVATDLAVCPFKSFSASGSLSTWISVARSILVSDLPQVEEYNHLEPAAIHTFVPYTPAALAAAIRQLLPSCQHQNPAVARLCQLLSLPVILDTHLNYYRSVALPRSEPKHLLVSK